MARDREKDLNRERGANLVEMALILPLLLLLLAAIADFGRAFNSYIVIHNAAREGARFGARVMHVTGIDHSILCAIYQEATNSGLDLGDCEVDVDGGLTAVPDDTGMSLITIDPGEGDRVAGTPITVTIDYTVTTIFTGLLGLNEIPMRSRSTMVMYGATYVPES